MADAQYEGIKTPDDIALEAGKLYKFTMWVYGDASGDTLYARTGSGNTYVLLDSIVFAAAWTEVIAYFTATTTENVAVEIYNSTAAPSGDFYIDDVSIQEVSGCNLLPATAVAADTDLTLTYPMRPVEYKALRLAITTDANGGAAASGDETVDIFGTTAIWNKLSGASASGQKVVPIADQTHNYQVGDTVILIDISAPSTYETDVIASIQEGVSITLTNNNTNSYATGDIVGIYQTEQIDTSAAHGTFWTTLPYGQIAMLTFTGYDGTNTAKVDQPIWGVIWDNGGGQYKIDANFEIGDGVAATYFTTMNEAIYVSDNMGFETQEYGILTFGELHNSWGRKGSYMSIEDKAGGFNYLCDDGGTVNIYASHIHHRSATGYIKLDGLTVNIINSQFSGEYDVVGGNNFFLIVSVTNLSIQDLYVNNMKGLYLYDSPSPCDNIHIHDCGTYGIAVSLAATITITNPRVTDVAANDLTALGGATTYIIDPKASIASPKTDATSTLYEQYTCNIHVTDKDGVDLQNVVVDCETTGAAAVWGAGTILTDASGDIVEQTITYKSWTGDAEVLTDYSPHKFTLSLAGYETLVIENVTVDGPIVWHLEMLPAHGMFPKSWR